MDNSYWVFAYGSLIFRVDFPFYETVAASVEGWQRRFWQGSHDHRGTPENPGRVLTLVPRPGELCRGLAYRVSESVFEHLDYREKNGYVRVKAPLSLNGKRSEPGIIYVADEDNHAYLGEANIAVIAEQINRTEGPSGTNKDYVFLLAKALRDLSINDPHVFEIERHLLKLDSI